MNSFNDPLLYIKGPPVFHLPPNYKRDVEIDVQEKEREESTSIYEIRSNMSNKTIAILEKLNFLVKPFQRKVYRPLVFHIEGGIHVPGEVEKVDDEFVTFLVGPEEKITYRVDQVEKIVWRGVEMK
ncbi:hypothetical protein [Psychrobacillus vulpis]|uniref:Uncharacterized protein n=1 Tax=Psychrobacillus vulpis TaxID=2325572 RepID=A0A544TRX3_9BACI|nr:hypothetical protein [Psychrobacillus vulpis]TQR20207.1 hypothetical protein FG384_08575 [Psychrobacillus vulpis]